MTDKPVYDGAGNETTDETSATYGYDSAGQLTTVNDGAGNTTYRYAGADQNELLSTKDHTFVYGGTDQAGVPAVQSFAFTYTDSSNSTATHRGYIERDNVGTPLGMDYDGRDYYFVPDGRGTINDLEDATTTDSQSLEIQWNYDPSGYNYDTNATHGTTGFYDESLTEAFAEYAGSYYDMPSGLVKMGRRWYDPMQYHFLQQDSLDMIGDPANGNRYAYAGDNPVSNIDPTGQMSDSEAYDAAGVLVGGLVGLAVGAAVTEVAGPLVGGAVGGCVGAMAGSVIAEHGHNSVGGLGLNCFAGGVMGLVAGTFVKGGFKGGSE